MAWLSVWVWVLGGVPLITLFPLLFPTGTLLSPRWRPVVGLALAALVSLSVGIAFAHGRFDDLSQVENPYGVGGAAGDVFSAMQGLGWLLLILSLIASATSLVLRFRRARGVERLQLKWVAAASVVLVASFLLWEVWEGIAPLGIFTMVLAAGIAILRYRLYDIDVVINRTLVYGALTATLALTYLGSVLLLQLALSGITEGSGLAVAASTLAVAALFRPARARIQEGVDRRFYRRKYDAARIGGTLDEIAASEDAVTQGKHPARPFVLLVQASLFDPTRAPEGKHTGWAYCHVPSGSPRDMTEAIEAQIERFAPGFKDLIAARSAMGPD